MVRELALRLLRGEVIEYIDGGGYRVRATHVRLVLLSPQEGAGPVIEGDAYDVAAALANLHTQ